MSAVEELYRMNLRLNRAEFARRRIVLESMPRYLSVVIGTRCNINCPYCYQEKTGDELLGSGHFGDHLRRELAAFYPYLSTFRIGGGEVFLIPGFEELVAEVSASAARPIISISTNGTLIDETWPRRSFGSLFERLRSLSTARQPRPTRGSAGALLWTVSSPTWGGSRTSRAALGAACLRSTSFIS